MTNSDVSPVVLWSMARESATAWIDDFAPSMGAGIAYYTAFSIASLLVVLIAIAGFFFGEAAAHGYLYGHLTEFLGDEGAKAIQALVKSAANTGEGIVAAVIGVGLLAVGATTVFAELQSDLDRIWKAPVTKEPEGLWKLIRSRVMSLGLVASIGGVLLVSLFLSAALSALGRWWGAVDDIGWLLHLVDSVVSFAAITAMFALMYKILPRVSVAWHDVWIGALTTALLFTVGKVLVGLYLGKSGVTSGFGAAGSLAVLLIWVYYSAQIFLFGAEFTWVYAHRFGSRRGQDRPATAKESVATTREPHADARPTGQPADKLPDYANWEAPPSVPPTRTLPDMLHRHPIAFAGGALLLGALIGELMSRRETRN